MTVGLSSFQRDRVILSTIALRSHWVRDCGIVRREYAIEENEHFIRFRTRGQNGTLHETVLRAARLNSPSSQTV